MSDTEAVIDLVGNDKLSPAFRSAASSGDELTDAMMGLAEAVEQVSSATKDETKVSAEAAKVSDVVVATTGREVKAATELKTAVKEVTAVTTNDSTVKRESTRVVKESTEETRKSTAETQKHAEAKKKAAEAEAGWLGTLKPVIAASREYAENISKATAGTEGWIKGLGHISVTMDTISKGGLPAVIAGLDLWTMGFGAVKRAGEVVVGIARDFAVAAAGQRDLAISIGTNITQYSGFAAAVQLSGKDLGNAREMLGAMQGRMLEAITTTGKLTGAWQNLGVSLFDMNGQMKTSTDLVYDIADAFQGMPDGPQKTAMAIQLLGEQGTKWIPILNQGSIALKANADYAGALGATYTKADAEIGDALKKSMARVGVFVDGASNALGRMVTPAVTAGFDMLGAVAEKAFLAVASNASAADLQLAKLEQNQGAAEQLKKVDEADQKLIQTLRDSEVELNKNRDALAALEAKAMSYTDTGQELSAAEKERGKTLREVVALQEKEKFATMDTVQSHIEKLEAMKKSAEASWTLNAADLARIEELDKLIAKEKASIDLVVAGDTAAKAYLVTKQKSLELGEQEAKELEKRNLNNKALAEQQSLTTAIFNERAHQIALTKTAEQELALSIMKAQDSVVQAERDYTADRRTRAEQLKTAEINARREVFDAETALMAQSRTQGEQIAKHRLNLSAQLLKADTERIANRQNIDLVAQRAIQEEETKTENMRMDFSMRALTRSERLKQAELQRMAAVKDQEELIEQLRAELGNKSLMQLEAKRSVEVEVLQQKRDQAMEEALLVERERQGLEVCVQTAGATAEVANNTYACAQATNVWNDGLVRAMSASKELVGGMRQIEEGTRRAADAAAALQAKIEGSIKSQSSLKQIQAGQDMSAPSGVTYAGTRLELPQQGLPGAAGMSAVANYQADLANYRAHQENAKREADYQSMLANLAKSKEASMSQQQKDAKAQQDQLAAKKKQITDVTKNADFNRQMAELDLMLSNASKAQENKVAPSLAGLKNQSDVLAQQSSILDTRRQLGNSGALAGGQNVLDLLSQQKSITDTRRTLDNFNEMAAGANTLDVLSQRANILNTMRTMDNFSAMSEGMNVLDLLTQEASIQNVARTISNFGRMASGANVLDVMNQSMSNLNANRELENFGAMTPGLSLADRYKDRMTALEEERTGKTTKMVIPESALGGRSLSRRTVGDAEQMGRTPFGFSEGTGLSGVPGDGWSDSVPAMLTPGEIVLSKSVSDRVRDEASRPAQSAGPRQQPIDYELLAATLVRAMEGVKMVASGREVGRLTVEESRKGRPIVSRGAGVIR